MTFEKNLVLTHLTTRHSAPDMTTTLEELQKHLKEERAHEVIPGRRSNYVVPNLMERGQQALWNDGGAVVEGEGLEELEVTIEDVAVEIAL